MTDLTRKPIRGYEGLYEVDNLGNVYSLERDVISVRNGVELVRHVAEKPLRQAKAPNGYMQVSLTNSNGKKKTHHVHRLVAEAFVPNPYGFMCVNHKDETRDNNRADNLEWCTWRYNSNYGTARDRMTQSLLKYYETHDAPMKGRYTKGKLIIGRKKGEAEWTVYKSIKQASREIGSFASIVSEVCSGKRKSANGYVFAYAQMSDYEVEEDG
jgi:hypothetical protein